MYFEYKSIFLRVVCAGQKLLGVDQDACCQRFLQEKLSEEREVIEKETGEVEKEEREEEEKEKKDKEKQEKKEAWLREHITFHLQFESQNYDRL